MALSIRTCVGCRQRGPAGEMVRLALQTETGALRLAPPRRGRGASLHARPDWIVGALRPGVLARAFKRPVDVSSEAAERLRQLTEISRNQGTK
jgi:uncharacterized protein